MDFITFISFGACAWLVVCIVRSLLTYLASRPKYEEPKVKSLLDGKAYTEFDYHEAKDTLLDQYGTISQREQAKATEVIFAFGDAKIVTNVQQGIRDLRDDDHLICPADEDGMAQVLRNAAQHLSYYRQLCANENVMNDEDWVTLGECVRHLRAITNGDNCICEQYDQLIDQLEKLKS